MIAMRRGVRRSEWDVPAGGLIASLPKVAYGFSNLTSSSSEIVVLTPTICVERLRALELVVRVHALSIADEAVITIRLLPAAPTRWEPDVDFLADEAIATVTVTAKVHPGQQGALLRAVTLPPLPTHVQLQLVAQQAVVPVTITAELSIDLTGHD